MEELILIKCSKCSYEHWIIDKDLFDVDVDHCNGCGKVLTLEDITNPDETTDPYLWISWIEDELENANRHSFTNLPDTMFVDMKKNLKIENEVELARLIATTLNKFI